MSKLLKTNSRNTLLLACTLSLSTHCLYIRAIINVASIDVLTVASTYKVCRIVETPNVSFRVLLERATDDHQTSKRQFSLHILPFEVTHLHTRTHTLRSSYSIIISKTEISHVSSVIMLIGLDMYMYAAILLDHSKSSIYD